MTKKEIVDHIVNTTTLSRSQAITATESVIEAISNSLANGESVFIRGFATFKATQTAPKIGRNIGNGTPVNIPARNTVKLILCKQLKKRIN